MGVCQTKKPKRDSIKSFSSKNSKSIPYINPPFQTNKPNDSIDTNSIKLKKEEFQNSTNSKSELNDDSIKPPFKLLKNSKAFYYPNKGVNETVIKIEIDEKEKSSPINNEFIFILDISGSMGSFVNQILTKVIPKVYEKFNYPNEKKIHLITFESNSKYYYWNKYNFMNCKIFGDGGTNMSNVPYKLGEILNKIDKDTLVNILTLSDGEISDQELTLQKAESIYNEYNDKFNYINSNAIRFLSYPNSKPDTRALCSLLRFNKNSKSNLIEFHPGNVYMTNNKIEEFSNLICDNFNEEISGWKIICENNEKKLRIEPIGELKNNILLKKGNNTFFYDGIFDNLPDLVNVSSTDGSSKSVSFGENVNQENLNEIYEDTIFCIFNKVINNKIINTNESKKKNKDFINYIKVLESKTEATDKIKGNNRLSRKLEEINSNNEVTKLNPNQLNDFIQKEQKECENELKEIQKEIDKITKLQLNNNDCTILFIDNSIYMKNYIDNLIQNVIYQSLVQLDLDLKYKIRIYGFDEYQQSVSLQKLKNLHIYCDDNNERKIFKALNNIGEQMINEPDKKYNFICIFSGEIDDKEDVRILAFKMLGLRDKVRIKSRIVKYITNESNFAKLENGEIDENKNDEITYGLIKQIDSEGLYSCKPLIIYENEEVNEKIDKFTKLFFRDKE